MSAATDSLNFAYSLAVERLTTPAGAAAEAIGRVNKVLAASQKLLEKLEERLPKVGERLQSFSQAANTGFLRAELAATRFTATTQKIEGVLSRIKDAAGGTGSALAQMTARAERASRVASAAPQTARGAFLGGHHSFGSLLKERALAKAGGMGSGLADSILSAPGALLSGAGNLAVTGISAAAGAAWDLAKAGAEGAFSFAKMAISAQALREQSVEGFKIIYGSESAAERLFSQAVRIAKTTKFDTPEVVEVFNTLAAGGFKENELEGRFGGYSDVASARGTGYARRYLTAIQKLQAQPNAMFASFQQGAMAGPGLKLAEEVLAKQLGVSGGNIDAKLREMFREKKISGSAALAGIEGAVAQRYDQGGKLGTFARAQGEGTWEGLISNIRNGLADVLTMKLAPDHPMNKLKDTLKVINSLFDDSNDRARQFNRIVSGYLADVFSVFDIGDGNAQKTVDSVLQVLDELRPKFKAAMLYLRDDIIKPILDAFNSEGGVAEKVRKLAFEVGTVAGQAIFEGLKIGASSAFTPGEWEKNNRKIVMGWLGLGDEVNTAVTQQVNSASSDGHGRIVPPPTFGNVQIINQLPPNAQVQDYEQGMTRAFEGLARNPHGR